MIYEAPYSAWYVSGAGNTLQLLNLWDATPEPPRFGGDIEVFETSLVDGTRAFAEGLGSAVEHRTFAFYRWFKDYEEMARYQENLAVWMATNQNGTLYMQFADQPQWRFTSVLAGYQFETENFIPPPSPEDGYLCLLVSINMTLTDRVPDNSAWVFSVTPSSVSVPAAGGQYAFSVVSYFNPGEIGQGWKAFENDGISISNIINGNNGSFRVTVPPNETTEEKSIYLTVSQDGTGIAPLIEITQAASTPQEKTVGSPVFLEGDPAKIAALGTFNWRQYRMKWGEQVDGDPPPPSNPSPWPAGAPTTSALPFRCTSSMRMGPPQRCWLPATPRLMTPPASRRHSPFRRRPKWKPGCSSSSSPAPSYTPKLRISRPPIGAALPLRLIRPQSPRLP